ncbi:MAG: hypothetical protein ACI9OJ_001577 [Myxococcota bacterium]|jgi:hypothetical protein
MAVMTATWPAGQTRPIRLGHSVAFPAAVCSACPLRPRFTKAKAERGRASLISEDEALHQELRRSANTKEGRTRLRQRVTVEHSLAHIGQRQRRRARYFGVRANLFDLRRAAAIQNLETVHRKVL